ncbi:MAG TPA: hypothetical protein VE263_09490 [Candidatus Angelobacter sp.]|nr:hypothetical protein [Candidatus Angelobacter sp.]
MYRVPLANELLSQGDIFHGKFAFSYIEEPGAAIQIVRNDQVISSAGIEDAWQDGSSEVILSVALVSNFAIILTQSCDAENAQKAPLDFVAVGAVRPFTEMPLGNQGNCRHNKLVRYHYLPADAAVGLPESFVHFGILALVAQQSLAAFKAARLLTLEPPFREDLGHRFGEFFSRVALP